MKDGVAFLGARASNPVQWTVSQDVRSEGHRVVTLHCRRKEASFGKRSVTFQPVHSFNAFILDLETAGIKGIHHQKAAGYLT